MRSRASKNNLILLLLLIIGFIGMGYAMLTTNINITGTGKIKDAKWDVHFANIQVTDGSVAAATVANITDDTSAEFAVTLEKPGDFYEFTMDVVNAGTIDAMVDSFSTTPTVLSDCVSYTVTWINEDTPKAKDSIPKGETYQMKIRVEMLKDITVNQLLTTEQTLILSVQLDCVQATEDARPIILLIKGLPFNPINIRKYEDGDKTAMYTITHPDGTIGYRYIGNVPNNYIDFNNETWRIIGVLDGKIKIIRNDSIGDMAWDSKDAGVGSSTYYGSNDWRDSQLMYMLNPNATLLSGYSRVDNVIRDNNGYIVYQEGKMPAMVSTTSRKYPTDAGDTPWMLDATASVQAVDSTYYIGSDSNHATLSAEDLYQSERHGGTWIGKVALMYASDYAYTLAYGVNDDLYAGLYYPNLNFLHDDSWLASSLSERTLTKIYDTPSNIHSIVNGTIFIPDAYRDLLFAWESFEIRPVVYLDPSIKLTGTGSSSDHYKIVS